MKRLLLLAAVLATPLLRQPAAAQPAPAIRSDIPALRFVPLQRLPRAPAMRGADLCRHLLSAPRTEAGRQVAAAGWAVTREAKLGPYDVVSFVGAIEPGTSGSCRLGDGNLGIFRAGGLVAIAYAPTAGAAAIGTLRPFGADALRLWDGDFLSQPVADLRLGAGDGLTIQPLAAEEPVCGGSAMVPNIYGRPIDQARAMLLRHGWTPAPPAGPREGNDPRVTELVRRGLPEVEDCSGTGFGFCGFTYRGTAGTLNVTTVGDNDVPAVAGYDAICR
ncbi:hypothetical protein KPL78_26730 [Roseomonas sp. HJA6]|uniref:Uncharacterized protein n=1 Tax=Roseomonas alba TaxID=2846776 RepID=A0ABS7AHE3_9PROT|nr:hypothetical protein [Neoroseomonas alba]MBW6401475.1 hypothetical protein [Neoroseomonas alba]